MGKVRAFNFEFTGNKAVFYPGQWVSGDCKLVVNEALKIKSFNIRLVGEAGYCLKRGGPVKKREFVIPVQNQVVYGPATISLGEHVHQFRFQIPPENLPTSFEGEYGFIRYYLVGVIERPWKDDITTRKVFTVWEYVDCNNPLLSAPQVGQSEKLQKGGCCSSAKRSYITLQLDRRGYCPGENVIVSLKVEDFPPGIVVKMMLTMVSMFRLHDNPSGKGCLSKRDILQTCSIGTVPGGSTTHRFPNASLQIPSVPPTIRWRGKSGLNIQVFYLAEVKMFKKKGKKARQFWHVNVPVTMGTIPLNPTNFTQSHAPLRATLSNQRASRMVEPPPYEEYNISPSAPPMPANFPDVPPTYEECCLGSSALEPAAPSAPAENIYGDSNFNPVYTMARGARIDYSFAED
ncbi:hypothetical protein ACHWQZ_G003552 [Mnemiopsis leidyi]